LFIHELESGLSGLLPPVAVDTEFHSEHRYLPKLLLVQLRGADGEVRVVDPKAHVDLEPLGRALSGIPLLVHAGGNDLPLLAATTGLKPGSVMDPQILAAFAGLGFPRALGDLCREVLGVELPGGQALTDWNRRPLEPQQVVYAAADVLHLHALVEALTERIPADRRGLALAACAEARDAALTPVDPQQAWKRIAAARVLDATGRDILQRLAAWRELQARTANQPHWQVASDAILLDLARRRPTSAEQMGANRKFPKRLLKKPDAVLACVAAGQERDDGYPNNQDERARLVALDGALLAWASANEARGGIAARLLLPQGLRTELSVRMLRGDDKRPDGWRGRSVPEMSQLVTELQVADLSGF
jgi:ribonuclease D